MKKFKRNKNKGIVFWITGLSGSGKTRIGKKIKKDIIKNYGPTILFSGDDIRNIFNFKKYSFRDRLKIVSQYSKLSHNISNQKINVIFCVVGMNIIHDDGKSYEELRKMHITGKFPKGHKCKERCDQVKLYEYLKKNKVKNI